MDRRDFLKGLVATCAAAPFLKLATVAPPPYDDRRILRLARHLSKCDELMVGIKRQSALILDNWGIQSAYVRESFDRLSGAAEKLGL